MTSNAYPGSYSDLQGWCEWRNREIAGSGLRWMVGNHGTPFITDDPVITAQRHHFEARRQEDEVRRANMRHQRPLNSSPP